MKYSTMIRMRFNDRSVRLIARLDVKGESLIEGVHLEGLRVIGDPQEFARTITSKVRMS